MHVGCCWHGCKCAVVYNVSWGTDRSTVDAIGRVSVHPHLVRGQGGWVGRNAVPIIDVDEEINVFGAGAAEAKGCPERSLVSHVTRDAKQVLTIP